MHQRMRHLASVTALFLLAGCDQVQSSFKESLGANPSASSQSPPVADAPATAVAPVEPVAVTPTPPANNQAPGSIAPPAITAVPPSQRHKVSLSGGVALAQTLPDGTAMGFSVDYQFTQGGPNQSARYAWVIVPSRGKPVSAAVQLEESGTLQSFFPPLRPEDGPFRCLITEAVSEGQPQPISTTVSLR